MRTKPKITIAVVCFNEERNITDCLESLLNQSGDPRDYEVLVVDNNSSDKTIEIVRGLARGSEKVRSVVNPKRGIAASRNVAINKAKGKFLAFTDADCIVPKDWLRHLWGGYLTYHLSNPQVVAVGGPNVPPKTTRFYQALGLMLDTWLGSRGSVQARVYLKDRFVPHLPCVNVLFEKKKIKEVGGFDESLGSIIEDEDLTYRLSRYGYRFVYLAKAWVIHKMRNNFVDWAKNMFKYGKGRMWFLKKYPEKWHLFFLAPIFLVLFWPLALPVYLPAIFVYSLWVVFRSQKTRLLFLVFTLFMVTHLSYGAGEIYGLFKKRG